MEITDLLRRAHDGDAEALRNVIPLVYDELKRLASSHLRREHSTESLETTVLVHEAFLRLAGSRMPDCENRSHFFGIAARVMRRVLVDMARSRRAAKRGPASKLRSPIYPIWALSRMICFWRWMRRSTGSPIAEPSQGPTYRIRYFFAGSDTEESGETLSLPVYTVRRELRLAQAWLHNELA